MKRTSLVVAGFSATIALGLIGYGCTSGDNVSGTGGSKGSGGQTTGGGQGGQTTSGGQGGMTTGGGQGGMTTGGGQGGMTTGGGQGGMTTGGGQGGATGGGQGGATGGGQGGSSGGLPVCAPAPKDKAACLATDITPCTKNCGVNAAGQMRAQKPCACIASTVTPPTAWDCTNQGACTYPPGFVTTCFALTPAPPACPTTPALPTTGTTACVNTTGATCGPLCGSATTTVMSYMDSSGAKAGFCACINSVWQCASAKEWPVTM